MTILDRIIAEKTDRLPEIRAMVHTFSERKRPLHSLIENNRHSSNLSVIAEIKRGSPSLGCFAPDLDVLSLGQHYQACGASAVSVLTDENFFGTYGDLEAVAPLLNIPVLAKDFIIDPAQITRAYFAGADIILLIASVLTPGKIVSLADTAFSMGMEVLLELHSADEFTLSKVPAGMMLGINSRNLKTFDVSLQTGLREIERLKDREAPIIAESGIRTADHARALRDAGFSGMLIGESLIRSGLHGSLIREMTTIPKGEKR